MKPTALVLAATVLAAPAMAIAQDFPVTIETNYGTTVIDERPVRVATIDASGADDLLALGVQPVVIKYWFGDYPRVVWPWADALLEDVPDYVVRGDLDFEAILAADPDVIIALWSNITQADFDRLSQIAPVVAVPPGVGNYDMSWDDRALRLGLALGLEQEAEEKVEAIRDQLAEVAQNHPEWDGLTVSVAAIRAQGDPGAYTSGDIRAQLLADMGFETPEPIEALATEDSPYWASLSLEDLSALDGDLIVWLSSSGEFDDVLALTDRPYLSAVEEGREILAGKEMTGAFSHATLLSLPYVIENIVPMIETALDGDPETHADDR
ncbi:ABC transporter substrate-binding protein [Pelagibacterium mangrovi]|uniref:ABC transporter substrate-binding protein n=1 Tax=Pelagibacterium mangrovi TaxID=3119828 RepID=UPI002FC631D7